MEGCRKEEKRAVDGARDTQDVRRKKRQQWGLRMSCHLPSVASVVPKAVAGICRELLKESPETVPEQPDNSWCGAGASDAVVLRWISVSARSHSPFSSFSQILSCRDNLLVSSAADALFYSNTSSITVKKNLLPASGITAS